MDLTKTTGTLIEVKLDNKKTEKSVLKNVTGQDFVIKSKWDARKVSKNFIKKLVNAEKVSKHCVIGEFVIKTGDTRKLKKCNLNEVLDRLPLAGYNTVLKKDKTRMYINK